MKKKIEGIATILIVTTIMAILNETAGAAYGTLWMLAVIFAVATQIRRRRR